MYVFYLIIYMTNVAPENPTPQVPDQNRSINIQIPEIKMPDKDILGKAANTALDKISQAGYYVMKYGVGMPVGFAAELVGPATMWLPKIAVIGAGYGLDKLGSRHPDGKIARLVKGLGEGLWKGGAVGLAANIVADKIMPGTTRTITETIGGIPMTSTVPVSFTDGLADKIHALDIPSIISTGNVGAAMGGKTIGEFAGDQVNAGYNAVDMAAWNAKNAVVDNITGQGLKDNLGAAGVQLKDTFGAAVSETADAAKNQVVAGANLVVDKAGDLGNAAVDQIKKAPGLAVSAGITGAKFAAVKTLHGAGAAADAIANYGPQMSTEAKLGLGAAAIAAGAGAIAAKEAREAGEAPVAIQTPTVESAPVAPVPPTHQVEN